MKNYSLIIVLLFISSILNAQWQQTNGPTGGDINSLIINDINIFAGTATGGIFLSTNNGNKWKNINNSMPNILNIKCIVIKNNNLFVGTEGKGIYLSTNYGVNWDTVNNGLLSDNIECLSVSGNNILAGTWYGLYISIDNGGNWIKIDSGLKSDQPICFALNGNNIFAGFLSAIGSDGKMYGGGIYLSTNNGITWSEKDSGLTNKSVHSILITNNYIFAGTEGGVFVSSNYGDSWTESNSGLTYSYVKSLAIEGNYLYAGTFGGGVYVSTNNGSSWSESNNGLNDKNIICMAANNDYILAGTWTEGVFKSTDNGASWIQSNIGLTATHVFDIALDGNNMLAGTWGNGISSTTDNGDNWTLLNNGFAEVPSVTRIAIDSNWIFAGMYMKGGIYISSDFGNNWHASNDGLTNTWVRDFAISGKNILVSTGGGLFSYDIQNDKWNEMDTIFRKNFISGFLVKGDSIFAGTDNGIFLSIDNGFDWEQIDSTLKDSSSIFCMVSSQNKVYAGTFKGGLYFSTNNGFKWFHLPIDSTNVLNISSIAIYDSCIFVSSNYYNNDNPIASGEINGVYLSKDNGTSWAQINSGLINTYIEKLLIKDGYIFAATGGAGVYKAKLSDFGITDVKEDNQIEVYNYLYAYPPYPMPAINIVQSLIYWDWSIDIDKDEIDVYNIYGKKIEGKEKITIEKINQYSGYLIWDCSDVDNGIYFIQLKHGTNSLLLKILVDK